MFKLNKDTFLKGISLIEVLTNQKVFVTSKRIILNNRTKQNIFNLYLKVVLRKDIMLNFLSYLNCFIFSEMRSTYSFSNYSGNFYFYKLSLKNIMLVRILQSNFLMWLFPIFITFKFNSDLAMPLFYPNKNLFE